MLNSRQRKRLLLQMGGRPRQSRQSPWRLILSSINWEIVVAFGMLLGFFGFMLWQNTPTMVIPGTVGLVVVGWVFSLCLHEFGHAATAVLGGDQSETTIYYLSFNPLRYVNVLYSIIFPLIFLFLGGIALPGGAVYLRRDLVRNRAWQSAILLAGPAANALLALALAALFHTSLFDAHPALADALALLAFFQIMAVVLNLLPVPPLDGFGVLAPWLPAPLQMTLWRVGNYAILAVFLVLWYLPLGAWLFSFIEQMMYTLGIDPLLIGPAYSALLFWQAR